MQTGLHAIGIGLTRLGVVLVVTLFAAILTYCVVVFAILAAQAFAVVAQSAGW
jgi:hypothetical protein